MRKASLISAKNLTTSSTVCFSFSAALKPPSVPPLSMASLRSLSLIRMKCTCAHPFCSHSRTFDLKLSMKGLSNLCLPWTKISICLNHCLPYCRSTLVHSWKNIDWNLLRCSLKWEDPCRLTTIFLYEKGKDFRGKY